MIKNGGERLEAAAELRYSMEVIETSLKHCELMLSGTEQLEEAVWIAKIRTALNGSSIFRTMSDTIKILEATAQDYN
jgi:hypothetical protein